MICFGNSTVQSMRTIDYFFSFLTYINLDFKIISLSEGFAHILPQFFSRYVNFGQSLETLLHKTYKEKFINPVTLKNEPF